jgi:hypothetical protein
VQRRQRLDHAGNVGKPNRSDVIATDTKNFNDCVANKSIDNEANTCIFKPTNIKIQLL